MRSLLAGLAFLVAACGSSAPDAGGDAGVTASGGGGASGSDGAACTKAVDAKIASGCLRCWPAFRPLCTKGNPAVVEGLLACLTMSNFCWDVGDPNTAVPCMKMVVDAHTDANVKSVEATTAAVGCSSDNVVESGAYAAAMSDVDRAAFAACLAKVMSCKDPLFDSCFSKTSFDLSLCMN